MHNKPILVVPTYSYLSYPIIEKLAALASEGRTLACLDFYQPRAEFGLFPESDFFSERKKIYPDGKYLTLSGGWILREKLLDYLNELNPEFIFTFSDITLFARCIKGTRFESILFVVQPCLLSRQAPSFLRSAAYRISSVINRITRFPLLREKHYWGEVLDKATYFVWGEAEKKTRKISGKVYECGDFFLDPANSSNLSGSRNSVLVIVPDLPYYTKKQVNSLTASYSHMLDEFPYLTFYFKYHPRNAMRLILSGKKNYAEIEDFPVSSVGCYDIVLTSYSNLSVLIRRIHNKVVFFDIGWYVDFSNEYFGDEYFKIAKTKDELLDKIHELRLLDVSDFTENSYHESFFFVSSEFLTFLEEHCLLNPKLRKNDI